MTHISLFSGIGGIDLAAEWAGFTTIAQVECDPYCLAILAKHWPDVPRCDDIRKFPDRDYGAVTLISGGFPCQPFSTAGKRRGRADDRHLWPEMLRVIQAVKPAWVLAENVPAILDSENQMVFQEMFSDLEDEGFETIPLVIPACGIGAWHRRNRVFFVAHSQSNRHRGILGNHYESHSENRNRAFQSICGTKTSNGVKGGGSQWEIEPPVGRMVHGIRNRMDRLRALGNAVVPQQVYPILQAIMEVEI